MSLNGLPPPPPGCLSRPYSSNPKRKGGSIIVEDVADRATHERRRHDPDGYRPRACPGCGHRRLHVHDYVERRACLVVLVRYLCPACGATWRMMPLFLARMLWRSWPEVEAQTLGLPQAVSVAHIPARTTRRWRGRLASAAASLLGVLRDQAGLIGAATSVGQAGTRLQLVTTFAQVTGAAATLQLAHLAATIHGLVPGVRLM